MPNYSPGTVEVQTDRNIPWVMNFISSPFSHKQMLKPDGGPGTLTDVEWDIWMPPPKRINGTDAHQYAKGDRAAGVDVSWEGLEEFVKTLGGTVTGLQDIIQVSSIAGQINMDETQAAFGGSSLRVHNYEWELVPTTKQEAISIEEAAHAFHIGGYPRASGLQTSSRMIHPSLWVISSFQTNANSNSPSFSEQWRWDMQPLPAVITNVNITNQGSAGGSYALGGSENNYPVKTNLTVTFVEIDPAINNGSHIISRSMVRSFNKKVN